MLTIPVTPETLSSTLSALPADATPVTLLLAPGVYAQKLEIHRPHTTLEGVSPLTTRITWADAANHPHPDGLSTGTFRSYTLFIHADHCALRNLTIENAAAPREAVGQCIALFADGDHFLCENCILHSYQDTLFTAPLPPKEALKNGFLGPTQFLPRTPQRHTYRSCRIEGDVDFIFGGAAAWFEDCDIVSINGYTDGRTPGGYATAASTPEGQKYGYIFERCRFLPGENVPDGTMYLGRPWREFAKTVLLRCHIGPHIKPEGWNDWNKPTFPDTGFYAEYACTGPGSATAARAPYARVLTDAEAAAITYEDFLSSL